MIIKCIVRDADNIVVDRVKLPDDWTGSESEWQVPDGYIAVDGPGSPGDTYDPQGGTFTKPAPPPPTVEDVRAEAERRIALLFGKPAGSRELIYAEINGTMRGVQLAEKLALGEALTSGEEAERTALKAIGEAVIFIRQKSNVLEAAADTEDGIPQNYTDDSYWSA